MHTSKNLTQKKKREYFHIHAFQEMLFIKRNSQSIKVIRRNSHYSGTTIYKHLVYLNYLIDLQAIQPHAATSCRLSYVDIPSLPYS